MDRERFEAIVREAKLPAPAASSLRFDGNDPVHPSRMALGEGAAAVVGMVGAAIDDIWAAQTGRRQEVAVDVTHAALGISSAWLLRVDGELAFTTLRTGASPVDGQYTCADGRQVLLMTGTFPRLAQGALEVLGCAEDKVAIEAAIATWNSTDLEAAMTERALTGVVLRTHDEWLAHPQGQVLRDTPAVEIARIGDAPPTPLPAGTRPLSGLRVLDATRVIAGPTNARTLAEFGADVLHVESPNVPDGAATRADTGHGKLQALVDLETPEGVATMRDLIATADVFSQSYRAGSMAARGFGPEAVAALRPGIVYVSETAYGHAGPWQGKRGFDGNVQAASGIALENGRDPRNPNPVAMAMNDYSTGYWGAYGVLEALKRRATEGGSWHVQVSLAQTARWFMRLGTPYDATQGRSADELFALAATFSEDHKSPYGALTRLRPILQMSETAPHWTRTTELPGTHPAAWPVDAPMVQASQAR